MIVTLNGYYKKTAITPNFSVLFSTSQSFRFRCLLTTFFFFFSLWDKFSSFFTLLVMHILLYFILNIVHLAMNAILGKVIFSK